MRQGSASSVEIPDFHRLGDSSMSCKFLHRHNPLGAILCSAIVLALIFYMADLSFFGLLMASRDDMIGSMLPMAALDPRRYFDIPLGLPPLPKCFRPVRTATIFKVL